MNHADAAARNMTAYLCFVQKEFADDLSIVLATDFNTPTPTPYTPLIHRFACPSRADRLGRARRNMTLMS
jgi:hypothetical protein